MLTILHAPGYGPSSNIGAVRFACAQGADSIGFTEAYRIIPALRRRVSYRCRVGNSKVDTRAIPSPRGDAGDVPILVRRRRELIEWSAERVTVPGHPLKYGPERWLTSAVYAHPFGDVEHIVAHPNPRFVDDGESFAAYMARLEARAVRALRRGHILIVTGDLQDSAGIPRAMFDRLDLDTWRIGIDWLGYSPHLLIREQTPLVDPSQVGVDQPHPWMLARFAL